MSASEPATSGGDASGAPLWRRILPDAIAFVLGLGAAWYLKWEATDLVWSLWLSSLVLGYLTLLSALAGGAFICLRERRAATVPTQDTPCQRAGLGRAVFLLVFFSIHFCGFHAGHSILLQEFFPLEILPDDGFGQAFINPPLLWWMVFTTLIVPYGIFLLPAILAERHHVFSPLIQAVRTAPPVAVTDSRGDDGQPGRKVRPDPLMHDAMTRPYLNVMRMHLLIFIFAFFGTLDVESFLAYAVVYFVYFLPWAEFTRLINKRRPRPSSRTGKLQ